MFGFKIVSKDYLDYLEEEVKELTKIADYRAKELGKIKSFFRAVKDNSKKMNKNEIVEEIVKHYKEMR